jgi:hypothetical protein
MLAAPSIAWAGAHLLLEARADSPTGSALFSVNYANHADFVAGAFTSQATLPGVANGFAIADVANDHGVYRLLAESRTDQAAGSELFAINYNNYADLQTNTFSSQAALQIDIAPDFSVRGFTYGDGAYHLLLESRNDAAAGAELFLIDYQNYADLVSNTFSAQAAMQADIAPNFSVAGLAFDNGAYRLLLESNADLPGGSELFELNYASKAALIANAFSSQIALSADVAPDFSALGYEYDSRAGGGVPEPASWAMMLLGFGAIGAMVRRRRTLPA